MGSTLKVLDCLPEDESSTANHEAAENHVVSRAAKGYATMVEDWFKETGEIMFLSNPGCW